MGLFKNHLTVVIATLSYSLTTLVDMHGYRSLSPKMKLLINSKSSNSDVKKNWAKKLSVYELIGEESLPQIHLKISAILMELKGN